MIILYGDFSCVGFVLFGFFFPLGPESLSLEDTSFSYLTINGKGWIPIGLYFSEALQKAQSLFFFFLILFSPLFFFPI